VTDEPTHPDAGTLQSFLDGKLPAVERQEIEVHVATCDSCCDALMAIPPTSLDEKLRNVTAGIASGDLADTLPHCATESIAGGETHVPAELVDHQRYRVIRELGTGGMGVVYQAQHRVMNRMVALKVINPRFVSNSAALRRFQLEVTCAAQLDHRNIVTAHDAEQAGQMHYLVMEYIDGVSLADLVRKRGALPTLPACNYAMQVAQGLQHAFEHGMVHRDIKPHNLMRTKTGVIKILDFGLARLQDKADARDAITIHGSRLGTPDYIAPEQARDPSSADIRADIYSLGCTLYYLLSGQVPFEGTTATEKIIAHCEQEPKPLDAVCPDLPNDVAAIVEHMMAKDPDDRFQTPAAVVAALKPFAKPPTSTAGHSLQAQDSSTEQRDAQPVRERPPVPAGRDVPVDSAPPSPRPQVKRQRKLRRSPRWLEQNRRLLFGGSAAIALLVAALFVLPTIQAVFQDPESNRWTDLIARCESRHTSEAIDGDWTKRNGELLVSGHSGSRMILPFEPPKEYDLEVQFTRRRGTDSIAVMIAADTGQATFEVDAWRNHLAGFQNIDGESLRDNSTRVEHVQIQNGKQYTLLVKVRHDRIEGYLDSKLLVTYRGDPDRLSLWEGWDLGETSSIGIGAYKGTVTFHRIRIRAAQD